MKKSTTKMWIILGSARLKVLKNCKTNIYFRGWLLKNAFYSWFLHVGVGGVFRKM